MVIQFHRFLENEIPCPYFLDMIHVNKIQNQVLKAHIQTEGYVIYSVPDLVFELLRIESKRNTIAQIINQGAKTENLSELTV